MKRWVIFLAIGLPVLGLGNCGGSGGVQEVIERPAQRISGVAFDAPIRNAVIEVHSLGELEKAVTPTALLAQLGEALATTSTTDEGAFSVEFQSASVPCLVSASMGQYTEESSRQEVSLRPGQRLYALTDCQSGQEQRVSITWLSSVAFGYALYLFRSGVPLPSAMARANQTVSDYVGFNILDTAPKRIDDSANLSPSLNHELLYGFVCAAMSRLTHRLSLNGFPNDATHTKINSIGLINAAVDDIAFDGVLNGINEAGQMHIGRLMVGNDLYRYQLATSLLSLYVDRNINRVHNPDALAGAISNAEGGAMPAQGLLRIQALADSLVAPAPFHSGPTPILARAVPVVTLDGIEQGELISGLRRLRAFVSFDLPTRESLELNGVSFPQEENGEWLLDSTLLDNGPASLVLLSRDEYGRSTRLERSFRVENRQLLINSLTPAADSYHKDMLDISFVAQAGLANIIEASILPDGSEQTCPAVENSLRPNQYMCSIDSAQFPDGALGITITVKDSLMRSAEQRVSYFIDNTAPVIEVRGLGEQTLHSATLALDIVVDEQNLNTITATFGGQTIDLAPLSKNARQWSGAVPIPATFSEREELVVMVSDMAGHTTITRKVIHIDNTDPVAELKVPTNSVQGSVNIEGSIHETNLTSAILRIGARREPGGGFSGGVSVNIENTGQYSVPINTANSELSEGVNEVLLIVVDSAGNTVEKSGQLRIDNTAPVIGLEVPEDWVSGVVVITGQIDEANIASAVLSIEDPAKPENLLSHDITASGVFRYEVDTRRSPINEGNNTVSLVVVDSAGHEASMSAQLQVDNTAPVVELNTPDGWVSGVVVITGQINEANIASAVLSIGNPAKPESLLSHNITSSGLFELKVDTRRSPVNEGNNTVSLVVVDSAGHEVRKTAQLRVDNTAPVIGLEVPEDWVSGVVVITGQIDEANIASAVLSIGDPAKPESLLSHDITASGSFRYEVDTRRSPINEGNNTVSLVVVDSAGHETSVSAQLRVDNTAPVVELNVPDGWVSGVVVITGQINETNIASAVLSIGNPAKPESLLSRNITASGSFLYKFDTQDSPINEGNNTVSLVVVDSTGHEVSKTAQLRVDNIAPVISLEAPIGFVKDTVEISGSIIETNLSHAVLRIGAEIDTEGNINNGLVYPITQAGAFSLEIDTRSTLLQEGFNTVLFSVTDAAGHQIKKTAQLLIDNTASVISLAVPTHFVRETVVIRGRINESNVASATLHISPDQLAAEDISDGLIWDIENTGQFNILVDSADMALRDGLNTVTLTVMDQAGQKVEKSAQLRVDNTAPVIGLEVPEDWVSGVVVITGQVDETNIASAVLRIGNPAKPASLLSHNITASGSFRYEVDTRRSPINEGNNTVTFTVLDLAGHEVSKTAQLRVDNTAPVIELEVPEDWVSGEVVITGQIDETNIASAVLSIGDPSKPEHLLSHNITASGSFRYEVDTRRSPINEGNNSVSLIVVDAAGHETSMSAQLQVDNTAPVIELNVPDSWVSGVVVITGQVDETNIASAVLRIGNPAKPESLLSHNISSSGLFRYEVDTRRSPINEGNNSVSLIVVDAVGHEVSKTAQLRVDNTAPVIELNVPDRLVSGVAVITGQVDETNIASAVLRIGNAFSPERLLSYNITASGSFRYEVDTRRSPINEGNNIVSLVVVDSAGHEVSKTAQLQVDNTAPVIKLNVPDSWVSGVVVITGQIDETNIASAVLRIGNASKPESLLSHNISSSGLFRYEVDTRRSPINEGNNSVSLIVVDAVGHEVSKTAQLRVDNTAPVIELNVPDRLVSGVTVITGQIDETNIASAVLRIGNAFRPENLLSHNITASGSFRYEVDTRRSPINEGNNIVSLVVLDAVGHETSMSAQLQVDNTAPTILLSLTTEFVSVDILFEGMANDPHLSQVTLCIGQAENPHHRQNCLINIPLLSPTVDLIDADHRFSYLFKLDDSRIVEGNNTVALIAEDAVGNISVSRLKSPLINGVSETADNPANVFRVDRIAPVVSIDLSQEWLMDEIVQFTTKVQETNLDTAYLCIGVDLDPAANDEHACQGGLKIPITLTPSQVHALDLRALPEGIRQGKNPVTLFARDLYGHTVIHKRSSAQNPDDASAATLNVDTIPPQGLYTFSPGISSGVKEIHLRIMEQHLASVRLELFPQNPPGNDREIHETTPTISLTIMPDRFVADAQTGALETTLAIDSTLLTDGNYQVQVLITDLAGHQTLINQRTPGAGETPVTETEANLLQIDNTAPRLQLHARAGAENEPLSSGQYLNHSLTVSGKITEANLLRARLILLSNNAQIIETANIDLIPLLTPGGEFSYTINLNSRLGHDQLPDGGVGYRVEIEDKAGYINHQSLDFFVDTVKPKASLALPETFIAGSVEILLEIEEVNLEIITALIGSTPLPRTQDLHAGTNRIVIESTNYPDGEHPVSVYLRDRAGNETSVRTLKQRNGQAPRDAILRIDNTVPSIRLQAIPAYIRETVTVSGTITEKNLTSAQLRACNRTSSGIGNISNYIEIDVLEHISNIDETEKRFSLQFDSNSIADGQCELRLYVRDAAGNHQGDFANPDTNIQTLRTYIDNTPAIIELDVPATDQRDSFVVRARIKEDNLHSAVIEWPRCENGPESIQFDLTDPEQVDRTGESYLLLRSAMRPHLNCLPDGTYPVTLRVQDQAGNQVATRKDFTRDTQAPTIALSIPSGYANLGYYRGIVSATAMLNDARTVEVSVSLDTVDDIGSANCSDRLVMPSRSISAPSNYSLRFNINTSQFDDGRYLICVMARDDAGNQKIYRQSYGTNSGIVSGGIVIDNTAAQAWLHPVSSWVRDSLTIRLAIEELNTDFVSVDFIDARTNTTERTFTIPTPVDAADFTRNIDTRILPEGKYWLSMRIREKTGRLLSFTSHTPLSNNGKLNRQPQHSAPRAQIQIDRTAPVVQLNNFRSTARAPANLVNGSITVNAQLIEDNLASAELWLTGPGTNRMLHTQNRGSSLSFVFDTSTVADGVYQLMIRVRDQAGNSGNQTTTVTIDNTKARGSFTAPLPASYQKGTVRISYSITEKHLRSLDLVVGNRTYSRINPASTGYNLQTSPVGDGRHSVKLRLTDQFATVTEIIAPQPLLIDNTQPVPGTHQFRDSDGIAITQFPPKRELSKKLQLSFEASDSTAGFSSRNTALTVTYRSKRQPNFSVSRRVQCQVINTHLLRCRDDTLTYAQLSRLGISNTTIETCARSGRVTRAEHGLKVEARVLDQAGNTTSININLPSTIRTSSIPYC